MRGVVPDDAALSLGQVPENVPSSLRQEDGAGTQALFRRMYKPGGKPPLTEREKLEKYYKNAVTGDDAKIFVQRKINTAANKEKKGPRRD